MKINLELTSDPIREIISTHIFYIVVIMFMMVSTYRTCPPAVWVNLWQMVIVLGGAGITMASLSFFRSIHCWYLLKVINEMKDLKLEEDEDEEKEH